MLSQCTTPRIEARSVHRQKTIDAHHRDERRELQVEGEQADSLDAVLRLTSDLSPQPSQQ